MKKSLFIVLFLLVYCLVGAGEIFDMPDLMVPHTLTINGKDIYIAGRSQVFIYKYPNTLKKVFGKRGDGPGEFKEYSDQGLLVSLAENKICVCSEGRVSFFSMDGTFIEEKKTGLGHSYSAVNSGLVGIRYGNQGNFAYNFIVLVNRDMQSEKNLQKKKHWFQQGKTIDPVNVRNPRYCVMGDLIYAEDSQGQIHIFDNKGKSLGIAKAEYQRVEVSDKDQTMYHEYYKNHKYYKDRYHELKHMIKFPTYFPTLKFFDCSDNKIYVMTYVRKNQANEIYIFNKSGKFIRKIFVKMKDIPLQEIYPLIRIANNRVYQLFEEPDKEIWQLVVTKIPNK